MEYQESGILGIETRERTKFGIWKWEHWVKKERGINEDNNEYEKGNYNSCVTMRMRMIVTIIMTVMIMIITMTLTIMM